jgi:hypothetical protein
VDNNISQNWILKQYLEQITVLSKEHDIYLNDLFLKLGIPKNTNQDQIHTLVAWEAVPNSQSFFFDFENNEDIIKDFFQQSKIKQSKDLILEMGLEFPIIQIPTQLFINHWEDFVAANGFMGILCIDTENNLLFEFSDDSSYLLYSNFTIQNLNPNQ